jgi:hypothetical protein
LLGLGVAVGSLATLLDAGAKYPGDWLAAFDASTRSAIGLEAPSQALPALEFRVSGNLPVGRGQKTCAGQTSTNEASQGGDEPFDIICTNGGPTVKAVGALPRPELLSWPGDWLYHRALRF